MLELTCNDNVLNIKQNVRESIDGFLGTVPNLSKQDRASFATNAEVCFRYGQRAQDKISFSELGKTAYEEIIHHFLARSVMSLIKTFEDIESIHSPKIEPAIPSANIDDEWKVFVARRDNSVERLSLDIQVAGAYNVFLQVYFAGSNAGLQKEDRELFLESLVYQIRGKS